MTDDQEDAQQVRDDLESAIGHYMAVVASRLLDEGLPVAAISAYGAYDDESQDDFGADVEGSVEFTGGFCRASFGGGRDAGLLWCGVSGWCFFRIPEGSGQSLHESARWMGGGLTPEPGRVAAFFSEARLDPDFAGSEDRPFYRTSHTEPEELLERLAVFDTYEGAERFRDHERRFASRRADAYGKRVVSALAAREQEVVEMVFRSGELHALRTLLEYAEGAAPQGDARELARRLASDLSLRARHGRKDVDEHCAAFVYANERR
ncbi:hypothetical protein ACGFR6_02250 [Streptomyces sp. NPDC048567]|uniref:hypothetical protein n=1 Tax=unclassified Streptomyces TaxID=2593676 RepID=UPI002E806665|nr:hypothetical protein [Streptomyces sp. NBC_00523]WUC98474.1 hypothetical protein OHS17_01910 [Streptomyces sp. NBC_00523]